MLYILLLEIIYILFRNKKRILSLYSVSYILESKRDLANLQI